MCGKRVKRHFQCGDDRSMIREWSEHDPSMIQAWKRKPQPASQVRLLFEVPRSTIVKYNVSRPILHSNIHQVLRLPQKVTLDLHRILPLPRKVTRIVHPRDIWSLIYNARSNQCLPTNSPNTAPATQNDHLTCGRNARKTSETSFPMRGRSEHDPRMIREWSEHDPSMIRAWKRKPQPASQVRLLFEVPRSIFYWEIQRFEANLTFKHSPSAAPATKSNTWPSPNTAPATQSNTWPSPNTAPTTESNTHSSSSWHMKPHLQCAEQSMSPYKLTKYCACHAKWPLNVWQKCAEN